MIDTKHLRIDISDRSIHEFPPKLYTDWFLHKANLKRFYKDKDSFTVMVGLFKYHIRIEFKWNYVEREMTPSEKERFDRISKVFQNDSGI